MARVLDAGQVPTGQRSVSAEDSLQKAIGLFGASFFWRPISLILIAMILASVAFYLWRSRRSSKPVPSHA